MTSGCAVELFGQDDRPEREGDLDIGAHGKGTRVVRLTPLRSRRLPNGMLGGRISSGTPEALVRESRRPPPIGDPISRVPASRFVIDSQLRGFPASRTLRVR